MNTNVTRGTGLFVVTATGMATEVGHISNMLQHQDETVTPLTRQLQKLTMQILFISGAAVVISIIINSSRGYAFKTVFTAALAFAIAAIPTGPPGSRHDDPLDGHSAPREGERDRQAPALDGDARRDLGDQLRQDGNADAEPDDRGRDGDRRPPLHDLRHRLFDGRNDHALGRNEPISRSTSS